MFYQQAGDMMVVGRSGSSESLIWPKTSRVGDDSKSYPHDEKFTNDENPRGQTKYLYIKFRFIGVAFMEG